MFKCDAHISRGARAPHPYSMERRSINRQSAPSPIRPQGILNIVAENLGDMNCVNISAPHALSVPRRFHWNRLADALLSAALMCCLSRAMWGMCC